MKNAYSSSNIWNYLRVRGEYITWYEDGSVEWELPPRARRIPLSGFLFIRTIGTTSACAENTQKWFLAHQNHWNYLRVRGEYEHQGKQRLG